jgi:diguanylate cyclase (GGDEF)-like protein
MSGWDDREGRGLKTLSIANVLPAATLERAASLIGAVLGAPVARLAPGDPMGPPIRVAAVADLGVAGAVACPDTLVQRPERGVPRFDDSVHAFVAVPFEEPRYDSETGQRSPQPGLCVLSDSPRVWSDREIEFLRQLAASLGAELALRTRVRVLERATDELKETSFRDALTGLPNRGLFTDRLTHAIERAKRHREFRFAVLSIDVDRFGGIVDSLGHEAGDEVLITIGRRLDSCLRDEDTVAHAARDEFLVLLEAIRGEHDAIRVALRIQDALRQPIQTSGGEVFVTASVGIALGVGELESATRLLQQAGIARSRAKSMGSDRHCMFDSEMHERAGTRLRLETDLRHAVEGGLFELYYQPMLSLDTGRVVELEALVRWRHPVRGMVGPLEFIPIAEETGLIVPIGSWVLAHACLQLAEWQQTFPRDVPLGMSVNVSARQLREPDFAQSVAAILAVSKLEPSSLKLEITENILIVDPERARAVLDQLRALGVSIYLDDFGTGYSSLRHLHQMRIDALKIDYTFVAAMDKVPAAHQVVRTLADLARSLGVPSVAEGVESLEQLAMVRALGCDSAQGHLFSKPAAVPQIEKLLAADTRW